MKPEWPFVGANQQWDVTQIFRFPVYATAQANGVTLEKMWYGGLPTRPSRIANYTKVVADWKVAVPGQRYFRQLFNQFQFTGVDGGYFDKDSDDFVRAMAAHGNGQLWCLMDGPSQRQYEGTIEPGIDSRQGTVPGTQYWTHYYDRALIDADPVGSFDAAMDHIHQSQLDAWTALLTFLSREPDIYASTIGFELINEPASYRSAGNMIGDPVAALTKYVNHCIALVDLIDAMIPGNGHDIYVGGWGYSGETNIFHRTVLPAYGKTAYNALLDRIGPDRFVWSVHMYPQWTSGYPNTIPPIEAWARSRFGDSITMGNRISITEFNAQNAHFNDWRYPNADTRKGHLWSRNPDFFRKNNISIFWWPFSAWAEGSVTDARGGPTGNSITHSRQNSLMAYTNMASILDPGAVSTGADAGEKTPTFVPAVSIVRETNDPDYHLGEIDTRVTGYAYGYGGKGVCVVRGRDDAHNILQGGDGYTVLYGSENKDWLSLGRGGGVIRMGGWYSYANTNGGYNRIYGGPLWSMITCYHGINTIIVDPAATTILMGFDPSRGDRISFKGAFTGYIDLRLASAIDAPSGNMANEENLVITFPQGGMLTIVDGGDRIEALHRFNLDFTDSWYADGWVEPVDYTESQFDDPIVPPPEPVEEGVFPKNYLGEYVFVRDRSGMPVSPQFRYEYQ